MKYFRIKNWEKYQHRDHKKSMPWIKLYQSILDDPKMIKLSTYNLGVWCKLMLSCARVDNELIPDQFYLKSRLNLKRPVDLALFASLGLIEFYERGETAPSPRLDREERRKDLTAVDTKGGIDLKKAHEQAEKNKVHLEKLMNTIGSV